MAAFGKAMGDEAGARNKAEGDVGAGGEAEGATVARTKPKGDDAEGGNAAHGEGKGAVGCIG